MDLSRCKKLALWQIDVAGIVVCLLASLAAYLAGMRPLIEQRSLLATQRGELTTQREESSKLEASVSKLRQQLAVVQEELAGSEIELESADQINQRIAKLTALLADCTLEADDIQTGKTLAGTQCDFVPISIAGRGRYKQCTAFLHKLHKSCADIGVARLELQGNPAIPEQPGMFRLQLFWYTMPKIRMAKNFVFEHVQYGPYGLGSI